MKKKSSTNTQSPATGHLPTFLTEEQLVRLSDSSEKRVSITPELLNSVIRYNNQLLNKNGELTVLYVTESKSKTFYDEEQCEEVTVSLLAGDILVPMVSEFNKMGKHPKLKEEVSYRVLAAYHQAGENRVIRKKYLKRHFGSRLVKTDLTNPIVARKIHHLPHDLKALLAYKTKLLSDKEL